MPITINQYKSIRQLLHFSFPPVFILLPWQCTTAVGKYARNSVGEIWTTPGASLTFLVGLKRKGCSSPGRTGTGSTKSPTNSQHLMRAAERLWHSTGTSSKQPVSLWQAAECNELYRWLFLFNSTFNHTHKNMHKTGF